ncbi:MAG: dipeptidyl-peptidase-4 [Planctomycetota bacterium]|jgi:dipeptidyl-peptidase-4
MRLLKYLSLLVSLASLVACERTPNEETVLENPLTIERLYDSPLLSGELTRGLKISPDGRKVSFLKGKQSDFRVLDLYEFDLETGSESLLVDSKVILGENKEVLSDEEKARRERKRIAEKGIIEYQWSKQGDKILFPINGDIYLYYVNPDSAIERVTDTEAFEIDPRFSPKGNYISFVRDHNVYVIKLDDMSERQLSFNGSEEKPMGVAEFIAQEEMGRYRGYWWSPNEEYLAIAQVDNSPVGSIERFEVYPEKMSLVEQRYPKAGTDNAIVRLAIAKVKEIGSPELTWLPIEANDYYLPQVKWLPLEDNSILSYSIQTRDQKSLILWSYDVALRETSKLLEESDPAWINIRHDYLFLKNTRQLLWITEKSGYSHIHLYDWLGTELKALTFGEWEVLKLLAADEKNNKIYFTANINAPLEQHLYVLALTEGAKPEKISVAPGIHDITMAENPEFYVDNFSTPTQPFRISIHQLTGELMFFVNENRIDNSHPLNAYARDMSSWDYYDFKIESGDKLFYTILKPKNFNTRKKYPLIQFVYGGPGPQLVRKKWGDLFHQFLAQQGFIVLVADNRGTSHRGREFERAFYRQFGNLEVEDQSAVLQHVLKRFDYIDNARIGVYGHSYGGYLTTMLMLQKPKLYHTGVASAPVVDWTLYDTHYTERYLGKPDENKAVYQKANVTSYVDSLEGKLLLIHGMADDNVLYNNSLLLYQALQEKGKIYDVMVYPGAKHGIRGKKEWQIHYKKSVVEYFSDHLLNDN